MSRLYGALVDFYQNRPATPTNQKAIRACLNLAKQQEDLVYSSAGSTLPAQVLLSSARSFYEPGSDSPPDWAQLPRALVALYHLEHLRRALRRLAPPSGSVERRRSDAGGAGTHDSLGQTFELVVCCLKREVRVALALALYMFFADTPFDPVKWLTVLNQCFPVVPTDATATDRPAVTALLPLGHGAGYPQLSLQYFPSPRIALAQLVLHLRQIISANSQSGSITVNELGELTNAAAVEARLPAVIHHLVVQAREQIPWSRAQVLYGDYLRKTKEEIDECQTRLPSDAVSGPWWWDELGITPKQTVFERVSPFHEPCMIVFPHVKSMA
ncbi:hypothetical protein H4R34_003781 [Dimargaris verticillata]|uniref:Uncharacterized protein n=1 Tax=Dimargaris verticillata TaxID=2761393 RepID=A0A9W8ECU2_9FUNG|nr:hypothetical protein H4R34_003781 [Dimargaris verticillata]